MNLHQAFSQLSAPSAPAGLSARIMASIASHQRLARIRRQVLWLAPLTTLAVTGLLWALLSTNAAMAQSGFVRYFSLLFSDFATVGAAWDSFTLSLLESLPIDMLIVLFVVLLSTVLCVRTLSRDIGIMVRSATAAA